MDLLTRVVPYTYMPGWAGREDVELDYDRQ